MRGFTFVLLVAGLCATAYAQGEDTADLEARIAADLTVVPARKIDNHVTRGFGNPLPWLKNQLNNRCKCEGPSCECCFKLPWLRYSGCVGLEHLSSSKQVRVKLGFDTTTILQGDFNLVKSGTKCGNLPAPLAKTSICLTINTNQANGGEVQACPILDFKIGAQIGATARFSCLQVAHGKLTIGGRPDADSTNMFDLNVKDSFVSAMQIYGSRK